MADENQQLPLSDDSPDPTTTLPPSVSVPLWALHIKELEGKIIEKAGREEVNQMLDDGWVLLYIYTLKFREGREWRERPMAILGKPAAT